MILSSVPRTMKSILVTGSPSRYTSLPMMYSRGFSRSHTASSALSSSLPNNGTCRQQQDRAAQLPAFTRPKNCLLDSSKSGCSFGQSG